MLNQNKASNPYLSEFLASQKYFNSLENKIFTTKELALFLTGYLQHPIDKKEASRRMARYRKLDISEGVPREVSYGRYSFDREVKTQFESAQDAFKDNVFSRSELQELLGIKKSDTALRLLKKWRKHLYVWGQSSGTLYSFCSNIIKSDDEILEMAQTSWPSPIHFKVADLREQLIHPIIRERIGERASSEAANRFLRTWFNAGYLVKDESSYYFRNHKHIRENASKALQSV